MSYTKNEVDGQDVQRVRLNTAGIRFITEIVIPPFRIMPAVLCWQARWFRRGPVPVGKTLIDYYEDVFVYFVPSGIQGKDEGGRTNRNRDREGAAILTKGDG